MLIQIQVLLTRKMHKFIRHNSLSGGHGKFLTNYFRISFGGGAPHGAQRLLLS